MAYNLYLPLVGKKPDKQNKAIRLVGVDVVVSTKVKKGKLIRCENCRKKMMAYNLYLTLVRKKPDKPDT